MKHSMLYISPLAGTADANVDPWQWMVFSPVLSIYESSTALLIIKFRTSGSIVYDQQATEEGQVERCACGEPAVCRAFHTASFKHHLASSLPAKPVYHINHLKMDVISNGFRKAGLSTRDRP